MRRPSFRFKRRESRQGEAAGTRKVRAVFLFALAASVAAGGAAGAFQLPRLLERMPMFQVRSVTVEGVEYLEASKIAAVAGVDSLANIWEDPAPWIDRLETHPLIDRAEVRRRPPATLIFTIEEASPVALAVSDVLTPVDAAGNALPIDPTLPALDLPVVTTSLRDTTSAHGFRILTAELGRLAESAPDVYAVISEASRDDREVALVLGDSGVRMVYMPPIADARLREAIAVMNDALGRFPDVPLEEVDIRFEDQVVVRLAKQSARTRDAQ